MRAKDIASRLTGRMRQFRATSLGEFAVALIIFPLLLSVAPTPAFAVDAVWLTDDGTMQATGIRGTQLVKRQSSTLRSTTLTPLAFNTSPHDFTDDRRRRYTIELHHLRHRRERLGV